jgi:hypothetical protein
MALDNKFLRYAHVNPIRIYQVGNGNLDYLLHPYYEYKTNYFQKYLESDTVCLQLLLKEPGLQVLFDVYNTVTDQKINQDQMGSVGTPYGNYFIYQWNTQLLTPGYPIPYPMTVQIRITIPLPGNQFIYLNSEYIQLYPDNYSDRLVDNLMMIQAYHDLNDYNFHFTNENDGKLFLRVEGGFPSEGFAPGGKFNMYQDQRYRSVIMSAVPFNVHKLIVGANYGVPNWMIDKVNRLLALRNITINGISYARNEGAKLEPLFSDHTYPYRAWGIDLIESDNPYSLECDYVEGTSDTEFTADTTVVTADDTTKTIDQTTI